MKVFNPNEVTISVTKEEHKAFKMTMKLLSNLCDNAEPMDCNCCVFEPLCNTPLDEFIKHEFFPSIENVRFMIEE